MDKIRMMKALRKIGCLFLVATILVSCGTRTEQPLKSKLNFDDEKSGAAISESLGKALAGFNRGAALLEQYKYSEAARAFESVLDAAPDWTAARFNLGLAYVNMQVQPGAKNYLKLAQEAFETVLQSNPDHLHARFCLGLYHQHIGQSEKALECLRKVYEDDSEDPYVLYKYAEILINLGHTQDGTRMLEKVLTLDPGFISAVYRLAVQYQRTRQSDKN